MNPLHLAVILAWLTQIPLPPQNEALDAAPWKNKLIINVHVEVSSANHYRFDHLTIKQPQVEVCAGEGNLSRALQQCGYRTKAFDATWIWYIGSTIEECHL
jgi:hypothetical protein